MPPTRSRYAAKLSRRAQEFKEESQACGDAHRTPLTPDDHQPLTITDELEAKNDHHRNITGWKSRFNLGESHTLNGIPMKLTHIGKRSIILRPA